MLLLAWSSSQVPCHQDARSFRLGGFVEEVTNEYERSARGAQVLFPIFYAVILSVQQVLQ